MLANILDGIMNAISMGSLLANLMGVTLGIIFGALPGLTAAMGVALLIPLTFGMPAVEAFSALLGMYVGAIYGGCITAILVGTPGTVSAAATMLEGPALTARGESRRALDMATIASFVGGIVYVLEGGRYLYPGTIEVYNALAARRAYNRPSGHGSLLPTEHTSTSAP